MKGCWQSGINGTTERWEAAVRLKVKDCGNETVRRLREQTVVFQK